MYAWKNQQINAYNITVTDVISMTLGEEIWNKSKQIAAFIAALFLPFYLARIL